MSSENKLEGTISNVAAISSISQPPTTPAPCPQEPCTAPEITLDEWIAATQACCGAESDYDD